MLSESMTHFMFCCNMISGGIKSNERRWEGNKQLNNQTLILMEKHIFQSTRAFFLMSKKLVLKLSFPFSHWQS